MKYIDLLTVSVTFHDAVTILWTGAALKNSSDFIDKKTDMMRVRIAAFRTGNCSLRKPIIA